MEMTWENLTKLFTCAAQHGSAAPMADTAGETIVIDGAITRGPTSFHGLSLGSAGAVILTVKDLIDHRQTLGHDVDRRGPEDGGLKEMVPQEYDLRYFLSQRDALSSRT